jgi:DNA-binding transcriptional LysR family regulator
VNLRQLEVFHAIMTTGSLTEAARNLNVTQPSISTVLKHAEDQLGVKLFQRMGGRLVPTPEAEQLFPEVDRIFSQLSTLKRFTKDLRDGRSGYLAIIGNPTLTNALLTTAVARFRRKRPQVRIRLESGGGPVTDRVARREFDLGFVYGPAGDTHTDGDVIGSSEIAVALRADHPLAKLEEIRASDLIGHDIITFRAGAPIRRLIEENFHNEGHELSAIIEVSYSITACLLAGEGTGVGIIDPVIFRTGPCPNVVLRPFVPTRTVEFQLLHPKNRPRSQLSKEFEDVLRGVIAESQTQSYVTAQP